MITLARLTVAAALALAAVLMFAIIAARAAETFDWGKYCGSGNEYCDPSDSVDNKWEPPSQSELRRCTKSNGKLDYACLRKTQNLKDYEACFREEGGKLGRVLIKSGRLGSARWMSAMPLTAARKRTSPEVRKVPFADQVHRSKERPYSITSSARARSVGGTSSPSALAVLRLITS
jgi:hypothetical protein